MPLLTSPPISANLMRLESDFLSPKNGGGEAPRTAEVELNGLTDLDELIKEAGLPATRSARPSWSRRCLPTPTART